MELLPDQLKVLQGIINTAAQTGAVLQRPIEHIEKYLSNISKFIHDYHKRLPSHPIAFLFDDSTHAGPILNLKIILSNYTQGNCIFYVDEDLHVVKVVHGEARIKDCVDIAMKEERLCIRVAGTYFHAILSGKIIEEGDFLHPHAGPPIISKFHHPIAEFDLLLQDHMTYSVDNEKHIRYWKDKEKRILLSGPDGTEKIFHLDLFWWLDNYVSDKLKIVGETSGMGQDKTDILVITGNGTYIIEIKWLGENEQGTKYDQKDINKALAQVKIYLENDNASVCGYPVIYDGRPLTVHETQSNYDDSLRHNLCEAPKILFLKSETPSKAAKKIAKEIKK